MHELDEELFFIVDEKGNTVDLTEKGRNNLSKEDREQIQDQVEFLKQRKRG